MPVTYQHAMQFVGRPVIAHLHDGKKHYGVIQNVTRDGIWLRPLPRRGTLVSSTSDDANIFTADQPEASQAEQVFWPAVFFLPFLVLAFLAPFFWW